MCSVVCAVWCVQCSVCSVVCGAVLAYGVRERGEQLQRVVGGGGLLGEVSQAGARASRQSRHRPLHAARRPTERRLQHRRHLTRRSLYYSLTS